MVYPEKWRETVDPFSLPYRNFRLTRVLGYPHAGNDVFHALGLSHGVEIEVYIKFARQRGADIQNEIRTIQTLSSPLLPRIIDCDEKQERFIVTKAMEGERLSVLVGDNMDCASMAYLYEYGQTLASLHTISDPFPPVKDCRFFHIPEKSWLDGQGLSFVYDYLTRCAPTSRNLCFCHGDFHYANILWKEGRLSAILDFEFSGEGIREFDIAWALILRPGQKFLNTKQEILRFLDGYQSIGSFDDAALAYYMALIYCYFYPMGEPDYQTYVLHALHEISQS